MDAILESLSRGIDQLLARANGPLHFRLLVMPTVVTLLALRAGLKDAREGEPAFLWEIIVNPAGRRKRLLSAWNDIARVFILALVLDTAYQLIFLRAFYVEQALIVAVACAIAPYALFRGPTTRLVRALSRKEAGATNTSAANTTEDKEGLPGNQDCIDE